MKLQGYRVTITKRIQVIAISSVFRCVSATFWGESSTKVRTLYFFICFELFAKLYVSCELLVFLYDHERFHLVSRFYWRSDVWTYNSICAYNSCTETLESRVHCTNDWTASLLIDFSTLHLMALSRKCNQPQLESLRDRFKAQRYSRYVETIYHFQFLQGKPVFSLTVQRYIVWQKMGIK